MPWVRYAVPDDYCIHAGSAVDWGRPVERDAIRSVTIHEVWVDDMQTASNFLNTWNTNVTPYQETVWNNWTTPTTSTNSIYRLSVEDQRSLINQNLDAHAIRYAEQREQRQQELREREEQRQRRRQEQEEAARLKEEAEERALDLLKLVLSTEERDRFQDAGDIVITGSDGNRYMVDPSGYEGNVYLLDEQGRQMVGYCCHPQMWNRETGARLPTADAWVTQVLALKANAEHFLATANVSWRNRSHEIREEEEIRRRDQWPLTA